MLRISKLTDYAIIILVYITKCESKSLTAEEISKSTRIRKPTASKILKLLVQKNILKSKQGNQGGYSLANNAQNISLEQIIAAIEGPVAITDCSTTNKKCPLTENCPVISPWQIINTSIINIFKKVSLTQLSQNNCKLDPLELIGEVSG